MAAIPTRDELIRRAVARRRAHRVRGLRDLGEWVTYIRPDYSRPDHFPGLLEAFDKIQQGIPQFILLEAPPRHAKTDTIFAGASRNLVTFPDRLVAYCTYSSDFARDQSRKAVTFALRGGVRLGEPVDDVGFDGSTSARFWQTPQGGGFLAVGRGGGIKGKGVHLLIVDDPFKDRDEAESAAVSHRVYEWWTGTLFDRLEPGGSVIITHQRWNDQDLIARITKRTEELATQDKPHKPWVQLTYPAIDTHGEPLWEQRYSAADLEEIRGEVGEYNWWSQFCQNPQPRGARLFVRPQEYKVPLPLTGQQLVISVDPAATENTRADPTAVGIGAISGRGDDRLLKLRRVWTFRVEVPELVDFLLVLQLCLGQQGHPAVPMVFEAIGAFKSVPQTLRRINHDLRILSVTPDKSKFVRAQPAAAATKRGQILLPNRDDLPDHELGDLAGVYERHADDQRWLNTPERIRELLWEADSQRWLDTFVDELTRFTGADGERDDQTDMVVHMWDKAESSFTSWEDKPKFRPRVMRGGGF